MAEAYRATRYGVEPIVVEGEYFDLNASTPHFQVSFEEKGTVIFIPRLSDLWRSFVRSVKGAVTKLKVGFTPIPLPVVGASIAGFVFAALYSKDAHWWKSTRLANLLWQIDSKYFKFTHSWPRNLKVGNLALCSAVAGMYTYAAGQRFLLRRLLEYHGFMSERGTPSIRTKIWYFLLKYLFIHRIHETLYAYQPTLPHLPLPALESTCKKYFDSVEPLMDEEEKLRHHMELEAFIQNEGKQLQRLLFGKWLISDNYISDWWLQAIYLRSRESLMINSNWFGITFSQYIPTTDQAARAANISYVLTGVHRSLENGTFEPQLIRGIVPLCMDQYQYVFGTCRIPHHQCDHLQKFDYSETKNHAAVLHKGNFYKLPLYSPDTRRQYTPHQLCEAFRQIMKNEEKTTHQDIESDAARLLPTLTTMNRDKWAETRESEFNQDPNNKRMLRTIESAAFLICIDDGDEPKDWNETAQSYFMGNGCNRWCDKSVNFIVSPGGKTGVHGEHSPFDAPTVAHITEIVALNELRRIHYTQDGQIKKIADDDIPEVRADSCNPTILRFNVNAHLEKVVFEARDTIRKEIADNIVLIQRFSHFGKKVISKEVKVSPDAFIQMCLQLAYFRDQSRFDLTYESSMTRFFKLGRTETIRSLSKQSCDFVRAFEENKISPEEQYALFKKACDHHQNYTHDSMCGHAVDRHLFGLYVLAIVRGIESPFLKNAVTKRKWRLSTSQIPAVQLTPDWYKGMTAEQMENCESPNGGFGPVAPEGYGICYMLHDNNVFFSCSSKVSADNTDSDRMQKRIEKAMNDLRERFSFVAASAAAAKTNAIASSASASSSSASTTKTETENKK